MQTNAPDGQNSTERTGDIIVAGDEGVILTDGGDGWDPDKAELRDEETPDEDAHARRNAEQLRMASEELEEADDV